MIPNSESSEHAIAPTFTGIAILILGIEVIDLVSYINVTLPRGITAN